MGVNSLLRVKGGVLGLDDGPGTDAAQLSRPGVSRGWPILGSGTGDVDIEPLGTNSASSRSVLWRTKSSVDGSCLITVVLDRVRGCELARLALMAWSIARRPASSSLTPEPKS